ncbi:MAG: 4'-phosphopantetheinyl transferase superfamily protein [Lautropia sp.]|nr:4'-phosphopantetheinyl transferase superfamily protein [Lautropia sp.]
MSSTPIQAATTTPASPASPSPGTRIVSCHRIDLRLPRPADTDAWLSEQEQARAARFRFPHLQARYRSTRVALRALLAERTGVAPDQIRFVRTPRGKPSLDPAHGSPLQFNLSHSGDSAWIAIGDQPLGIDLEVLGRKNRLLEDLIERVSTDAERQRLLQLPAHGDIRQLGFLLMWTRKESLLKGWGEGIGAETPLETLDTLLPSPEAILDFFDTPTARPESTDAPQIIAPPDSPLMRHLPPALILYPKAAANPAEKPPLHASSNRIDTDLVTVCAPEPFTVDWHLTPPAPFRHSV